MHWYLQDHDCFQRSLAEMPKASQRHVEPFLQAEHELIADIVRYLIKSHLCVCRNGKRASSHRRL